MSDKKYILLCGHLSFAALGLVKMLTDCGHHVVCFTRGIVDRVEDSVTGPVDMLHENPHLTEPFDTVINYILLKDESIQNNENYIDSLMRFCETHSVKHLIHISSISVYKSSVRNVDESAAVEAEPSQKGSYGALKVAADQRILNQLSPDIKLSLVRPGFILGNGLVNPIVGIGAKLPWNRLLVIGSAQSQMPVTSRELLNTAICKIVQEPPKSNREVLLLADSNSPTRREYLLECCRLLGCGRNVSSYPVFLWVLAGIGGEVTARAIGQAQLKPYQKISSVCKNYRFDTSMTEKRISTSLSLDWVVELRRSMDAQELNFKLPHSPGMLAGYSLNSIAFIGYGRIVKQKHLPALKHLGFSGVINAYDLREYTDPSGQHVRNIAIKELEPADLFVIATPGPAHIDAIERLRTIDEPILIEKPLCYSMKELESFSSFASSRKSPVLVCHNYRYKKNVLEMLSILSKYNPGMLCNVNVHFESPPVTWDGAAWLRKERKARTLLLDYSLHFLDLAFMFSEEETTSLSLSHKLNNEGQTFLIEGRALTKDYSVSFLLRQGFGPRRANIIYNFKNYSIKLSFFPDTCMLYMANDNPFLYGKEMLSSFQAIFQKVADKIARRDSDTSHALIYSLFNNTEEAAKSPVSLQKLSNFYKTIFQIEKNVYGRP